MKIMSVSRLFILVQISNCLGCRPAVGYKYQEQPCPVDGVSHRPEQTGSADVSSYEVSPPALPRLFDLDDYDSCLATAGATYCVVDLDLAEEQTEMYLYLEEYTKVTRSHYNRTRLHRGVCISERCRTGISKENQDLLSCLNRTFFVEQDFQVASLDVLYCESAEEQGTPDMLDLAVAGVLAGVLLISMAATALHQLYGDETNKYVIAFSIMRNWQILTDSPSNRTKSEFFKGMQGIRFITIVVIIGIHWIMVSGISYPSNAESIEQLYSGRTSIFLINLRFIVDAFFVMSGFLLAHQCLKTDDLSFRQLPVWILSRYLRLLPTIMILVAFNATWLSHLGSGPLWMLLVGRERNACRGGWWKQLLLMQNYVPSEKMCLPQTWHMAADAHYYILGLFLMVILKRHSSLSYVTLVASLTVSLVVPFLQSYLQELQPIVAAGGPETTSNFLKGNKTIANAYLSSVAHFSSFLMGMATALVQYRASLWKSKWQSSALLKFLFYIAMPLALSSSFRFNDQALESSKLEAAFSNVLDQNLFVLAFCIFLLGCINRCDGVVTSCLEWGPLQPLGRLTFCVTGVHSIFLWTYFGRSKSLIEFSIYNSIIMVTGITSISFLLAVPLYLMVELPSCHLLKIWLSSIKSQPTHELKPKSKSEICECCKQDTPGCKLLKQ